LALPFAAPLPFVPLPSLAATGPAENSPPPTKPAAAARPPATTDRRDSRAAIRSFRWGSAASFTIPSSTALIHVLPGVDAGSVPAVREPTEAR
jgi:hypothetical protein